MAADTGQAGGVVDPSGVAYPVVLPVTVRTDIAARGGPVGRLVMARSATGRVSRRIGAMTIETTDADPINPIQVRPVTEGAGTLNVAGRGMVQRCPGARVCQVHAMTGLTAGSTHPVDTDIKSRIRPWTTDLAMTALAID